MNADRSTSSYQLRLGVTGHRKLPDPEAVHGAVADLIAAISRAVRDAPELSEPLEWIVVSPLALGADRIVARAVLALPGARLEVISPFPLDDYRRAFKQPADLDEFEQLLQLDPNPTELDNDFGRVLPGDSLQEIARKKAQRIEGYVDVGRRVVQRCEILLAVWDGLPPAGPAATGAIVRYAVAQGRTIVWIDSQQPTLPPRRIVAFCEEGPNGEPGVATEPLALSGCELVPGLRRLVAESQSPGEVPKRR